MSYYDGFVAAVPAGNRERYIQRARDAWDAMFRPNGALSMVETWGDDVPDGEVTSFPMAVKAEAGEVVVFSWVEWPDKATRDAAYAKMRDADMGDMGFDMKRMIYGGFVPILSVRA